MRVCINLYQSGQPHRMTPLAIKALMLRITSGRTLFRWSSSSWLGFGSRKKDLGLKQGENWNGRSKPLLFQEVLKLKDGCSKKQTLIVPWECFCWMTIVFYKTTTFGDWELALVSIILVYLQKYQWPHHQSMTNGRDWRQFQVTRPWSNGPSSAVWLPSPSGVNSLQSRAAIKSTHWIDESRSSNGWQDWVNRPQDLDIFHEKTFTGKIEWFSKAPEKPQWSTNCDTPFQ